VSPSARFLDEDLLSVSDVCYVSKQASMHHAVLKLPLPRARSDRSCAPTDHRRRRFGRWAAGGLSKKCPLHLFLQPEGGQSSGTAAGTVGGGAAKGKKVPNSQVAAATIRALALAS
jgi:hypothetical protein